MRKFLSRQAVVYHVSLAMVRLHLVEIIVGRELGDGSIHEYDTCAIIARWLYLCSCLEFAVLRGNASGM